MGLMFIQAVTFADIPVMAAYLVLVGFFFVVINLVVDLLYYVVDPRLRIERRARRQWLSSSLPRPPPPSRRRPRRRAGCGAFVDSDLFWSFRRSPVDGRRGGGRLAIIIAARSLAPWIAPHDPFDLASLSLLDATDPPAWLDGGNWSYPLGTDNQGRDVLVGDPLRHAAVADGRGVGGGAGAAARGGARAGRRLARRARRDA